MITLFEQLHLFGEYYYVKQKKIVQEILFCQRIFYSKFQKIEEPVTPLLIEQHLKGDFTIALPLLKERYTHYLVILYCGEQPQRFCALSHFILPKSHHKRYHLYQGKTPQEVTLFIDTPPLLLEKAQAQVEKISQTFTQYLPPSWKTLPSSSLPIEYNIVTIPYLPLSS